MLISSVYCIIREIKPTAKIKKMLNQTITTVTYSIVFNDFGISFFGQLLYLVITVLKNIGTIVLLGGVNIILSIEIRKFYNRKKHLLKLNSHSSTGTAVQAGEISHSQTNYSKMTLLMFLMYVTGNIMNAVIGVCFIYFSTYDFFSYALAFGDLPQFVSYGVNIFIYYNFNSRYKKIFLQYMRQVSCNLQKIIKGCQVTNWLRFKNLTKYFYKRFLFIKILKDFFLSFFVVISNCF